MDENNLSEPPPPHSKKADVQNEPPQMSEIASLGNIFVEPGRVFEDMRRKPRFILAGLLVILSVSAFQMVFIEKFDLENIVRARIESSPRTRDKSAEEKATLVEQQGGPIAKIITYVATPIVIAIVFFIGGLIYWLLGNAMGGTGKYLGGVSVWVYASMPPALLFTLGNVLVMFLKSADDVDLAHSQGGLLKANLGVLVDPQSMPVISAILSTFDVFSLWGWILASIGLRHVAKISSGSAWAGVMIIALVGLTFKVIAALIF